MATQLSDWLPLGWFILVVALVGLLWYSGAFSSLLQRLTKVGGFGLQFEFTADSAKQTRDTVEVALRDVRQTIRRELEAEVRAKSTSQALRSVLGVMPALEHSDNYRATIHIPDPLYDNWLYQLVDYEPRGGGHGRSFSARAGIIGLAWRTETNQEWQQDEGIDLEVLIQKWGMTRREAAERRVDDKKVMLAVVLGDVTHSRHVGVLYLDSTEPVLFGAQEQDRHAFMADLQAAYEPMLAEPLTQLVETAMRKSPQLSLETL